MVLTYRLINFSDQSCSHLVIKVAQTAVTLSGSIEFSNLWDVVAIHELLPYGLPEAVAQSHAHLMLPFCVLNWLVQQVATDLTNVLHNLKETPTNTPIKPRDSESNEQHESDNQSVLTVQLYLTQSSQKREAENFFLMTTVMPCIIH